MLRSRKILRDSLTLLGSIALLALLPAQVWGQTFVTKWGNFGSLNGEFKFPQHLAADAAGNVYVGDSDNHRVQKFDSNGGYLTQWGTNGSGDGEFIGPYGVAVDASGNNVYVVDRVNQRVQVFNSDGIYQDQWGTNGTGDGQFVNPAGVAVDASGKVYVVDTDNHRIQKFESDGTFITKWGAFGTNDGDFDTPVGIVVDAGGKVYVADHRNHRVQKFESDGTFITKWGTSGTNDGEFNLPSDLVVDAGGKVYVTDLLNHRVQVFESDGTFITKWGTEGTGDGQFKQPNGIALSGGAVYVLGILNHRVQKFSISTTVIAPVNGTFAGSLFSPVERMIDGSGLTGTGALLTQTHTGGFGVIPAEGANFKTTITEATANPIDLDLGGTFDLTNVHIWNYTHADFDFYFVRDTQDIAISLSTDGISFTPAGSITLTSSGAFNEVVQSFPLTGIASHVRLQIQSNYGGAEVGLGEVRFETTSAPSAVEVSVPTVTATYNQALTIPVSISEASGIIAAEVTVEYDTDLLTLVTPPPAGVTSTGTLTDGWSVEYNTEPGGLPNLEKVKIAAATDVNAVTGAATLVNIQFTVNDVRVPASSALTLSDVLLNDGDPTNTTVDGLVTLVGNDATIVFSSGGSPIPRESITVVVTDADADLVSGPGNDNVSVTITNLNNGDVINASFPEDAAIAGTFSLVVPSEFGLSALGDAIIQAQAGDDVDFSYADQLDANGNGPITRAIQANFIGGNDGTVQITDATQPGDVIYIKVTDPDLNTVFSSAETAQVVVTSSNGESEVVVLTEVDLDDDVFFGSLNSAPGATAGTDNDGTINAQKGDVLTATYDDVVTAVGSQVDRTDTDQVVDPFGDADGNAVVQAFDAAQVLLHVLSPFITGLELIQANVDTDPAGTGVSPFDASLILQRRVGLISIFPVQLAASTNHPQPTVSSPKRVVETRMLALEEGQGYMSLVADERAGVLSGELVLAGVERAELAPAWGEYLIAARPSDEGLRVVFAGARSVDGTGEVLRLYGPDLSQVRVQQTQLNDGRIEARVELADLSVQPTTTALLGNYPNPFNPETTIQFNLAQAGLVRLEVFDALGQKVQTLVDQSLSAGAHRALWRGVDHSGRALSSGVYFYRLQAGQQVQMRRMLLLK